MITNEKLFAILAVCATAGGCAEVSSIQSAEIPDALLAATVVLDASGSGVSVPLTGCRWPSTEPFDSTFEVEGLGADFLIRGNLRRRSDAPPEIVVLVDAAGPGFRSITAPVYGRLNFASRRLDDQSQPACGFNFRVNPTGNPVNFHVAGDGRLHFEADARNATDATCTAATRDCVRQAPDTGELSVEVESVAGAEPGRLDASASVACERVRSAALPNGRTEVVVRATGAGSSCVFEFPVANDMVSVDVQVNGPTTVSYDVMVSGQMSESGTCGDGRQPTSCLYSVQRGAELRFEAAEVPGFVPVWSGACAAESAGSWTARIPSARSRAACGIRLEPGSTVDCTSVTDPAVSISRNGQPFPQSEIFVDVQGPEGTTFDLSAEAVTVPPATFVWEESVNGSFTELGRGETLNAQELECAMGGGYCQLRVTLSDACGQRRAGVYYRRQP